MTDVWNNVENCLVIWTMSENLVRIVEQLKKLTKNCQIQTENIQRLHLGKLIIF